MMRDDARRAGTDERKRRRFERAMKTRSTFPVASIGTGATL